MAKRRRVVVEIPEPTTEPAQTMVAWGRAHLADPVPDRGTNPLSAYDHDTVGRTASIANNGDRVRLCDPSKPCAVCRQRVH